MLNMPAWCINILANSCKAIMADEVQVHLNVSFHYALQDVLTNVDF